MVYIMGSKAPVILPKTRRHLATLGENIRFARLRRHISAELLAERAQMSRITLGKIEKGDPNVTLGAYASVLHSLGFDHELARLAADDEYGRLLQDMGVKTPKRIRR